MLGGSDAKKHMCYRLETGRRDVKGAATVYEFNKGKARNTKQP